MPAGARGDLFCAYTKNNRTLTAPSDDTVPPYTGGRLLTVHALGTRLRVREFEISCASNFYVNFAVATGLTWKSEGLGSSSRVACEIDNLNGEGSAVSQCEAWIPASDGSNYGGNSANRNVLGAYGLARVPIIWRFSPGEIRVAEGQVLLVRISPTTNGDLATARIWWEELD